MKTILVEIDVEGGPEAIRNINDLENAISSLEDELKQADFGSEEFKNLSKELTKARSELKNTELALEALDSEQVASEFGSLTGAIGDVSGAFLLLGGEDGTVAQSVEKIQTAIGVSMAFKGAIEGISSGRKLLNNALATSTTLQKINNATTSAATKIFKFFGRSVKTTSFAFKALKTAIISTGIGALVIGIMEGISALTSFISSSEDAEKQQELLDAALKKTNDKLNEQSKAYDKLVKNLKKEQELRELTLKAKGEENKISFTRIQSLQKEIDLKKKSIKDIQVEIKLQKTRMDEARQDLYFNEEEYNKAQAIRKTNREEEKKQLEILSDMEHKLAVMKKANNIEVGKAERDRRKAIIEGTSEEQKEAEKANKKEDEARFKLILARKEANAKSLEDFIAIEKLKRNHLLKNEQLTKYERILIRFQTEQEILKISNEFAEKAAQDEADRLKRIEDNAKQHKQNLIDIENDFRAELEIESDLYNEQFYTQQGLEVLAVEDKYNRLIELAKQYGEDTTQLTFNRDKAVADINEKFAKEELQAKQANEQAKIKMAGDALGAIGNFITAFAKEDEEAQRKAFNLNKAVSIAQALVNTSLAVTAALTAGGNPVKLATGTQFVEAGIAAVMGAAQVATIAKTEFQGGAGSTPPAPSGGLGGGTGATTQPPAFNVVGQSGFNQVATALGGQQPIKAFVVSQDVTTAQQFDNAIVQTATF